jgi:hypothetical protein
VEKSKTFFQNTAYVKEGMSSEDPTPSERNELWCGVDAEIIAGKK